MIAIITPCYKENLSIVLRNIISVQNQKNFEKKIKHFIIFDGIDREDILDSKFKNYSNIFFGETRINHDDYGDYIRRLGGRISFQKEFSSITFLDADNFWNADHLMKVYETRNKSGKDIIISSRKIIGKKNIKKNYTSSFFDTNTMTFFGEKMNLVYLYYISIKVYDYETMFVHKWAS
mgnify:CR=1 FL=1